MRKSNSYQKGRNNLIYSLIIVSLLMLVISCSHKNTSYAPINYYKNITPGVNQAFAVQSFSNNTFSLWGIEQRTKYDFGVLKQKRIKFISQDSVIFNNVSVPNDKIAFPSNLQINDDNSSVFLALRKDKNVVAYQFDKDGKYVSQNILNTLRNQVPLSILNYNGEYLILTNDTLDENLNSKAFIIKASSNFQKIDLLDSISYSAQIFSTLVSKNLFSSYYFFGILRDYCFLIKNDNSIYLNLPYQPQISSLTSISMLRFSMLSQKIDKAAPIFYLPNIFVRKVNFQNASTIFPISYDLINQISQVSEYDMSLQKINQSNVLGDMNAHKNILFVKNRTTNNQERIILGSSYDNQIRVLSVTNSSINFSFGSRYESEIVDAFWINSKDTQLLIIGNTKLYNQHEANFIYVLPKASIVQ